ncbi:OmpA family protein [bacterium]|nr:OmpA family protein [bacterium]
MASLLAIFILALIVMVIQLNLKQKELEEDRKKIRVTLVQLLESLEGIEQTQEKVTSALDNIDARKDDLSSLLEGVKKDLENRGITILVAENGSVLRIDEQSLNFDLGKYEIPEEYQATVDIIGDVLLNTILKKEHRGLLDTVFIEGHTDNVPNNREMGNWGLSTYRAISLWQHWTEEPGNCFELKNLESANVEEGVSPRPLISVSGYGETRPTNPEAPSLPDVKGRAQGRPEDRRIDIRFTIVQSDKENLQGIKVQMEGMRNKTRELINSLRQNE